MPRSAMPEHLNDPEEIENAFPDDSQFGTTSWWGRLYRWYNKETKTWFAFSYRCTEWWARWRKYPKVLLALKGDGPFRIETDGWDSVYDADYLLNEEMWAYRDLNDMIGEYSQGYLSRIQYWCRWHFAIQWPLMVSFHFYPKSADVPKYGEIRPDLDGKVVFGYWNHFDADLVYWMITSGYIGRNWK